MSPPTILAGSFVVLLGGSHDLSHQARGFACKGDVEKDFIDEA